MQAPIATPPVDSTQKNMPGLGGADFNNLPPEVQKAMKMASAGPVKGGFGSDDPNIIGWTE